MENIDKIAMLKEDMLIVYDPPFMPIYKYAEYTIKESESRYNKMLRKIAKRKACVKGILICTGMLTGIILINWFMLWLSFNELTVISMIYMNCMFVSLFFAVAEDVFSVGFLTRVKYKGKIREIKL